MQQYTLKVANRETTGSRSARRLRRSGNIPACVYSSKGDARHITVGGKNFLTLSRELAGGAALVELTDDKGETALTFVKDIQQDAIRDSVQHIDFYEVERGEAFTMNVPVHLEGETKAPGVADEGGMIDHKSHELEIRCRPSKLPDHIPVDVSGLSVGDAIHISDLAEIEGVEFLGEPAQVIVSCQPPTVAPKPEEVSAEEEVAADEVPASNVKDDDAEESEGDETENKNT